MAYDPTARAPRDLQRLSDLQYSVAAGEPDVRGWPVYASTGRDVGTVADLLVDVLVDGNAAEVVMLELDLGGNGRFMLAPVRAAWIDDATRRVVLDVRALDAASLQNASGDDVPTIDRRVNRVDDASALGDDAGIDPRELDARVRIEEGGTVDDEAPVAGVRYEGEEHTPHDYGRPDEAYGPAYGDGRIGFDKIGARDPDLADADAVNAGAADESVGDSIGAGTRVVRYRRYTDAYAGPDAAR